MADDGVGIGDPFLEPRTTEERCMVLCSVMLSNIAGVHGRSCALGAGMTGVLNFMVRAGLPLEEAQKVLQAALDQLPTFYERWRLVNSEAANTPERPS